MLLLKLEQLFSGSYSVEVTDSRGCSVIDNLEISENNEIISQLSFYTNILFWFN